MSLSFYFTNAMCKIAVFTPKALSRRVPFFTGAALLVSVAGGQCWAADAGTGQNGSGAGAGPSASAKLNAPFAQADANATTLPDVVVVSSALDVSRNEI